MGKKNNPSGDKGLVFASYGIVRNVAQGKRSMTAGKVSYAQPLSLAVLTEDSSSASSLKAGFMRKAFKM